MMNWDDGDAPAGTGSSRAARPCDRSLLVRAGWKGLWACGASAVAGATLLVLFTLLAFESYAGEPLTMALLFLGVVVFGQPGPARRARGVAYWLLSAVLACGAVVFCIGANQILWGLLSVGVFIWPEFLMGTPAFVAAGSALFFLLPFLFCLWWSGCFRPSRLLRRWGWLKLALLFIASTIIFWVCTVIGNSLPAVSPYLDQTVSFLLFYSALLLPWVLVIGSKCLRLEDGVGLSYVRPRQLGAAAWAVAALAAGAGAALVAAVPSLSATAWADSFTQIVALGEQAMELAYVGTSMEKELLMKDAPAMATGYALDALARSGMGTLAFLALGTTAWLISSAQRHTLKEAPKARVLSRLALAAAICLLLCECANVVVFRWVGPGLFLGIPRDQWYEVVDAVVIPLGFAAMAIVASYVALPRGESSLQGLGDPREAGGRGAEGHLERREEESER